MKFLIPFLICFRLVAAPTYAPFMLPLPIFPLLLASTPQHYVVNQQGKPFFMQGYSCYALPNCMSGTNVDWFFHLIQGDGFNSVMFILQTPVADSGLPYDGDPYGNLLWTNTQVVNSVTYTNITSVNPRFMTNIAAILNDASNHNVFCLIYPFFDDFAGTPGYVQLQGNTTNQIWQYGTNLGGFFSGFRNVAIVGAGDFMEPGIPTTNLWNWLAAGIKAYNPNMLFTAEAARPNPANVYSNFVNWNSTYSTYLTYNYSLTNWLFSPTMPSFMRENYGLLDNSTGPTMEALQCRQQSWWAVTSGDAGYLYLDTSMIVPPTNSTFLTNMTVAALTTTNIGRFFSALPWTTMVPDYQHIAVSAGYGTIGTSTYATTLYNTNTLVCYCSTNMTGITVQMTNLTRSSSVVEKWYDPTSGIFTVIATNANTGTQVLSTPGANNLGDKDWVLIMQNQ